MSRHRPRERVPCARPAAASRAYRAPPTAAGIAPAISCASHHVHQILHRWQPGSLSPRRQPCGASGPRSSWALPRPHACAPASPSRGQAHAQASNSHSSRRRSRPASHSQSHRVGVNAACVKWSWSWGLRPTRRALRARGAHLGAPVAPRGITCTRSTTSPARCAWQAPASAARPPVPCRYAPDCPCTGPSLPCPPSLWVRP